MQDNGKLEWEVPAGEWTIYRTAMLTTGVTNGPASPEATGLEVDKMSRKHVADHFDARMPESERKTYATVNPYDANSSLQESELLGPVRLMKY